MIHAIRQLDRILRGEATRPDVLRAEGIQVPVFGITLLLIGLGATYGACMGLYAVAADAGSGNRMQVVASATKVPLLFFLTLLVTLPSLYVFNALLGSRLTFAPLVRLMLGAMGVTLAVLASIGPIVAFFSVSTTSYAFMVLLNVLVFAISGVLGLAFLKQTLNRLAVARATSDTPPTPVPTMQSAHVGDVAFGPAFGPAFTVSAEPYADVDAQTLGRHTRKVFTIWMLVFGLVGSQMAWILRPFLGAPGHNFTWFRDRGSNFLEAVWALAHQLFA